MEIIIGGDLSIKDSYEQFALCKTRELFNDVIHIFKNADKVLVNLECAVTECDTPIKKIGPNLKAPLNTIKTLKDAGVTDCCLSNNHIFDFGKQGVLDTIKLLDENQIGYTGFGKDLQDARKNMIITDGKVKAAVINVCEHEYSYALENRMGAREFDPYDTMDDIEEAKKGADYVIVIYHGGKEDTRYPSPRLLKACRSMVKHGADIVLCQHSHAIGCYEKYMDGHILYGQGNFHFVCKDFAQERDDGDMWNTGLIAKISICDTLKLEFIPTIVDGLGIRLANCEEKKRLLSELEERSKSIQDGSWYDHWQKFAFSQERYKIVPDDLKEEIAHFIDCEAHSDVCKEIYKTYNHTNEID